MVTVEKYAAKVVDKVKDHVGPLISKALSHIGTDTARVQSMVMELLGFMDHSKVGPSHNTSQTTEIVALKCSIRSKQVQVAWVPCKSPCSQSHSSIAVF